jgi:hypothetical protein
VICEISSEDKELTEKKDFRIIGLAGRTEGRNVAILAVA